MSHLCQAICMPQQSVVPFDHASAESAEGAVRKVRQMAEKQIVSAQAHAATFLHTIRMHIVQLFGIESAMHAQSHSRPSHRRQAVRLRRVRQVVQVEKHAAQSHGAAHGDTEVRLPILLADIRVERQLLHASKTHASTGIGGHATEAGGR